MPTFCKRTHKNAIIFVIKLGKYGGLVRKREKEIAWVNWMVNDGIGSVTGKRSDDILCDIRNQEKCALLQVNLSYHLL